MKRCATESQRTSPTLLRRHLLIASLSLFMPSIVWPQDRARLIGKIVEAVNGLVDIVEWSTWATQAGAALRTGQPLPANPGSKVDFDERLERTHERVAALAPPEFDLGIPYIGTIPTGSFDATRDAIRTITGSVEGVAMDFREKALSLREFDVAASRVEMSDRALRKLSTILLQVMEKKFLSMEFNRQRVSSGFR